MAYWHKRARAGVAIIGVATAVVVFFAMGEREVGGPPVPVPRMDPKAMLEIYSGIHDRLTGTEKNFELLYERSHAYDDGSSKFFVVTIIVTKEDGRTFKATAREATSGKDQMSFELIGDVRLEDSDGFFLTTDHATYDRARSTAIAAGMVMFGKGRMRGSGGGITYDQANDVLTVNEQPHVVTTDESGATVMEFASGTAILDRTQDRLIVDGTVHAVRGEEVIDAERGVATLSPEDDIVRFLELRGNATVQGGSSGIDAMSARDIDLDYTDDGTRLEAATLNGTAAAALKDAAGTKEILAERIALALNADQSSTMLLERAASISITEAGGGSPQRISADALDLAIAADGALTRAVGKNGVRLELPPAAGGPSRTISAQELDGSGAAGEGLTKAVFTGSVAFTETNAATPGAQPARSARAGRLDASLADSAISSAAFSGDVTFEEPGLKACAARLDYRPGAGTMALSGASSAGSPAVAEEQIAIEGTSIDVALETRVMQARGGVRAEIRGTHRCRPAAARAAAAQGPARFPGLLKEDAAATIIAEALEYDGTAGTARFDGTGPRRPVLSQGDTSILADTLILDQKAGDLTAVGNAASSLMLDGTASIGRAHEIRYIDASRTIRYASTPVAPTSTATASRPAAGAGAGRGASPPASAAPPAAGATGRGTATQPASPAAQSAPAATQPASPATSAPADVLVNGSQGDLRATDRIEIILAREGGAVERMEAQGNVRLRAGVRTVTGGATFSYDPKESRYVMTGSGAVPVTIVERLSPTSCREFSGRALTFFGTNDRITIDGKSFIRTQIAPGACASATPAAR